MPEPLCQCQHWQNAELSSSCAARRRLEEALREYFGFSCFRPGQLDALLSVAYGQDTFVRMPTGGGKSVCMFLVPLTTSSCATGIIISPLVGVDRSASKLTLEM